MKVNKTQAILFMYQKFVEDGFLKKADYCNTTNITSLTFARYLSELKCFFSNFDVPKDIIYSRKNNEYYIVSGAHKY